MRLLYLFRLGTLGLLLLLTVAPVGILAQEGTGTAIVVGDAMAESLDVVQRYMNTQESDLLAEDVTYDSEILFEPIEGRDLVLRSPTILFGDAFTDVTVNPWQYIVAEDTVVVEFEFSGTNTGVYRTLPPTDIVANVPMIGVYEVVDGEITNIRQYFDSSTLQTQLGYPPYTGVRPIPAEILEPDRVDDVVDNPDAFYGTDVSIQGSYGDTVGLHAFTIWDEDIIDIGQEGMLVIDATGEGLGFTPVEGTTLQISGTVREFDLNALEAETGYNLGNGLFDDYENFTVLLADSATNVDDVETIRNIAAAPLAFYGEVVTVEGKIGDEIGTDAFVLYEDQLIGVAGQLVAFDVAVDPVTDGGKRVQVTGVVRPMALNYIETEVGQEFADELFAEYMDMPALIVRDIAFVE